MAWTQTTLTIKDAAGTNQPVIAYTDGTNFSFAHPLLDSTGAIISPATQATLAQVLGALQGATPAGANVIGKVTTDQSAHGTSDLVAADVTKVAGAAFALGQQAAGASLPVVLTAAQLTALTAPVLGAGSNTVGGVTEADGANAALGAKADAAAATDTGTFSLIALFKRSLQTLASILTACQAATPAGTNTIGTVGIVAGTALVGKVGIDQTTPGTTDSVTLATGQGAGATIGATTDAVVAAGAAGTLSAKLRRVTQGLEDLKTLLVLGAGTNVIGKVAIDQTTPGTTNLVQIGGSLPAGTNALGSVSNAANSSGGTSTYAATGGTGNALLTNAATAVKASAGNLYGVSFVNTGAAAAYVQAFDLAAGSVTLGTTVPKLVFWVPAGGSWEEKFTDEAKVSFGTAITLAATTTATGAAAPATGVLANVLYK